MSDSEPESDNKRIDIMLFEKDTVDVKYSVMNGTVQSPEKACTNSMNNEDNPCAQGLTEADKNSPSPSQATANLQRTLRYLCTTL